MKNIPATLIIVSGLSGSGKSTAARALEDEQYFVVDNLPVIFLRDFLDSHAKNGLDAKVAVVVDVRNRGYLEQFPQILTDIRRDGYKADLFFFDASDEALLRRFSETRRRHPLMSAGNLPAAILEERRLLEKLRDLATLVFDTTSLTVHELRRKIMEIVHQGTMERIPMSVHVQSFGYRFGIPPESDLVLDVRFMKNPYFVDALRPLTGRDAEVGAFMAARPEFQSFLEHLVDMLRFLLPEYEKENKSYLTISIGCTAGRHRSVAVTEELRRRLEANGIITSMTHRDLGRNMK